MPLKTLVIGLGNPILGDDGVGWKVVQAFQARPESQNPDIELDCLSLGGLSLMERMLGYERVILVDAMETGRSQPGNVSVLPLIALENPMDGHTASPHDTSLLNALHTAQAIGADVPRRVDIVAIEAKNVYDFSEDLSPEVAAAVPVAVNKVIGLLGK